MSVEDLLPSLLFYLIEDLGGLSVVELKLGHSEDRVKTVGLDILLFTTTKFGDTNTGKQYRLRPLIISGDLNIYFHTYTHKHTKNPFLGV